MLGARLCVLVLQAVRGAEPNHDERGAEGRGRRGVAISHLFVSL